MASPPTTPTTAAPRARRRALLLLGLLVGLVTWAGVVGGPAPAASAAVAPGGVACETRAGAATVALVVDFGGGRVRTRCVEPGGSGIDVLRRGGFEPVTYGFATEGGDAAVCAVRDPDTGTVQGCQTGPSCLTCLRPDSWGYYPGYRYAGVGAGGTQPRAGTVEAWRWGSSTSWAAARTSYDDLCGAPEPTPTTAPPTTPPPGGGGTTPTPADPGAGGGGGGGTPGGGGGGAGGGDAPAGPGSSTPGGGSSTTAPDGSSTTAAESPTDGSTTTEAAVVAGESAERGSRRSAGDDDGEGADDDERADGLLPTGASGGGDGGGGPPVVPLAVTALVVAGVAFLAIRARRTRGGGPGPDTAAT